MPLGRCTCGILDSTKGDTVPLNHLTSIFISNGGTAYMVEGTLDYMRAEALPAIFLLRCLSHVRVGSHLSESNLSKKGDQKSAYLRHMRQCQIMVRFESGVKTKFLAALNQLLTSFFQCHGLPWSHSFQRRYDMYIVKING